MPDKRFRTVFVVEPAHDVSQLKDLADDIKFITTGYEEFPKLLNSVRESLETFDPAQDAIVPVGKVVSCIAVGYALGSSTGVPIQIGVYKDKKYTFQELASEIFS